MRKDSGVPLAQFIKHLRNELQDAEADGKDSALRFELGPIELELELAVERGTGAKGGVKFWVLELGGEESGSVRRTQRMKLSLTPKRLGSEGKYEVSDEE
jgi:hypothetical protein